MSNAAPSPDIWTARAETLQGRVVYTSPSETAPPTTGTPYSTFQSGCTASASATGQGPVLALTDSTTSAGARSSP